MLRIRVGLLAGLPVAIATHGGQICQEHPRGVPDACQSDVLARGPRCRFESRLMGEAFCHSQHLGRDSRECLSEDRHTEGLWRLVAAVCVEYG